MLAFCKRLRDGFVSLRGNIVNVSELKLLDTDSPDYMPAISRH